MTSTKLILISNVHFQLFGNRQMVHLFSKEETEFTILIREIFMNDDKRFIVVGGDGSLIFALKAFDFGKIPLVFGFENGTVNFLLHFELKKDRKYLESIKSGNFRSLERHRLLLKSHNILFSNEFVIRSTDLKLNRFCININGSVINIKASELLIATQQGSTGYNCSAGGPIIFGDSIVINTIAPNRCNFRPIVIPMSYNIKIQTSECCGFADGTKVEGDKFEITIGDRYMVAIPDSFDQFEPISSLFLLK